MGKNWLGIPAPAHYNFPVNRAAFGICAAGIAVWVPQPEATAFPFVRASVASVARHAPCEGGPARSKTVVRGDSFWTALRSMTVHPKDIQSLYGALRKHYDVSVIRPGARFRAGQNKDGRTVWFRLRATPRSRMALCGRRLANGRWGVRAVELPTHTETSHVRLVLKGSLGRTVRASGRDPGLGFLIAELFSGHARLLRRAGTRLDVLVEKRFIEDEFVDYKKILAAELRTPDNDVLRAFFFERDQNRSGYYTEEGRPVAQSLLEKPIRKGRMTSGFGMRVHPVLGTPRLHQGIDYGAAQGTGVRAAAKGVVQYARRKGRLGKVVSLLHANGLVTRYAHLSHFAPGIREGSRIDQGQFIGFVGQTGLATGAHLHFEALVHGRHIDPRSLANAPAPPLEAHEIEAFQRTMFRLLAALQTEPEANAGKAKS